MLDAAMPHSPPSTDGSGTPPQGATPRPGQVSPSRQPHVHLDEASDFVATSLRAALERTGFSVDVDRLPDHGGAGSTVVVGADHLAAVAEACRRHALAGRTVVALTPTLSQYSVSLLLRRGARAALPRGCAPQRVVTAVRVVGMGDVLLDPAVLALFFGAETPREDVVLSDREREWLQAFARGLTLPQLADATGYSERQMRRHVRCLQDRLGVATIAAAVAVAIRVGQLPLGAGALGGGDVMA